MLRTTIMAAADTVLLFDAGAGTAQGGRVTQEDRYVLLFPDQFPAKTTDKIALFGVYDGHGSDMVSEHVRQHLPNLLSSRPEFEDGDYETAIAKAFEDEDSILLENVMSNDTEPIVSGSTVTICIVNLTKGVLVSGNVGDSPVLFAERDPATEKLISLEHLSKAHKPSAPSERRRIEDAGGAVHNYTGTPRVGTLNMSRALGDLQYKNPVNTLDINGSAKSRRANAAAPEDRGNFLSNKPHLRTVQLKKDSRYVLLCCTDGVSDITDDKLLMDHVMKEFMRGQRATDIAKQVTSLTAGRPESDNSTCVLAFLDGINS
ncbi:hypothetical protein VTN77DRAFT_4021 [Rasamsonia byssochlamydoides]|uniref:uncharacterized protein n=1 Tax=Rasamsonia byssochlamydoides TaxID=89139 RepID=UPI0037445A5C